MSSKEDRAVVTLGILIKIPPNLFLDLSPITLGRILFQILANVQILGMAGVGKVDVLYLLA